MSLLTLFRFFGEVAISGLVYNDWYYLLPVAIQPAAEVLGAFVASILF